MKFLAVDPSSTELGWAFFEDYELKAWGQISTKRVDYDRRFMHIITELRKLHTKYGFTELACESAIRRYGKMAAALEIAVTSIGKWAEKMKLRADFYNPATWKASVAGSSSAGKAEVAHVVYLGYPQLPMGQSDHITDAIGIGTHHYGMRRIEEMSQKDAT